MTIETTRTAGRKARAAPRRCGPECAGGERNNYFIGKRLTPQGYRAEQEFLNGRRRLLNRAIHGWGVVHGFALRVDGGMLSIGEGLALDRLGRELWQAEPAEFELDHLLVLDGDSKLVRADGKLGERLEGLADGDAQCWLLEAHYAEELLGPVELDDGCGCKRSEWDRTCETVVYSLRPIDCKTCCRPYKCELDCCCAPDTPCCGQEEGRDGGGPSNEDNERQGRELGRLNARGGCACLCEHLTGLELGTDNPRPPPYIDGCTRADLRNGVALACIGLARDRCDEWAIARIHDACGPRRLVKRNDLLFDLINGCDFTRIVEIGWSDWHRRETLAASVVPFVDFVAALGGESGDNPNYERVTRRFWVRFSRPVRKDTLLPNAFAMTVMTDQTEGGWREVYRVPIVDVLAEEEEGAPVGHASVARLAVSETWFSDGVQGRASIFLRGETHVEIAVRGSFIVDCIGQTVAADSNGLSPSPSGGSGPGGDFLSTFTVAQREPQSYPRRGGAPDASQGAMS
jgi:hypothetical protein